MVYEQKRFCGNEEEEKKKKKKTKKAKAESDEDEEEDEEEEKKTKKSKAKSKAKEKSEDPKKSVTPKEKKSSITPGEKKEEKKSAAPLIDMFDFTEPSPGSAPQVQTADQGWAAYAAPKALSEEKKTVQNTLITEEKKLPSPVRPLPKSASQGIGSVSQVPAGQFSYTPTYVSLVYEYTCSQPGLIHNFMQL